MKKLAVLMSLMFVLGVGVLVTDASATTYYFKDTVDGTIYYIDFSYSNTYANTSVFGVQVTHSSGKTSRGLLTLNTDTWNVTITVFEGYYVGYSIQAYWSGDGSTGYGVDRNGETGDSILYFYSY
jgi:hypothetical protein